MDLKGLKKVVINFRNERKWKKYHNPKDLGISLVLESSELLHHFQWKSKSDQKAYVKNHRSDIADELADILHNILLISEEFKIDLEKAFLSKIKKTAKKYPIKI